MRTVAIIPARGGSKRLPGKNVRELCGKPLIAWTIQAALDAGCIDRVYVSTEDARVAIESMSAGATVIPRPIMLALDDTPTEAVLDDALKYVDCDVIVLLQCTSPLRTAAHIDEAYARMHETGCVVTVDSWGHPNGAIYMATRAHYEEHGFGIPRVEVRMYDCPDIDTQDDWDVAEGMMCGASPLS